MDNFHRFKVLCVKFSFCITAVQNWSVGRLIGNPVDILHRKSLNVIPSIPVPLFPATNIGEPSRLNITSSGRGGLWPGVASVKVKKRVCSISFRSPFSVKFSPPPELSRQGQIYPVPRSESGAKRYGSAQRDRKYMTFRKLCFNSHPQSGDCAD
jgi:hypothetical protein